MQCIVCIGIVNGVYCIMYTVICIQYNTYTAHRSVYCMQYSAMHTTVYTIHYTLLNEVLHAHCQ